MKALNEKDYKYRAHVGNLWLQGCGKEVDLAADPEEATEYESKTEPTQIFNQMKKDKKVKKNEKLTIEKLEENEPNRVTPVSNVVNVNIGNKKSNNNNENKQDKKGSTLDFAKILKNEIDNLCPESEKFKESRLFEKIFQASYFNDAYTTTKEKYPFQYIRSNFLSSPRDLAEYLYEHKYLLDISHQTDMCSAYYHYNDGFKAFYEKAREPLNDSIELLNSLIKKSDDGYLTLYRGLVLAEDDELDMTHPGICWTYDKSFAEDFAKDLCINQPGFEETLIILKTKVPFEKIDWICSALLNADEPDEKEVRLFDDSNLFLDVYQKHLC